MSKKLAFTNLSTRHSGVSQGLSASYAEAARVCLDRHHQSPQDFELQDSGQTFLAVAEWITASDGEKNAWANELDATEAAAYGLALAGIEITKGLIAVRRAHTRSGADYYLAVPGTSPEDLENCLRLEVSGIDRGSPTLLRARLRQKIEQASRGHSNLPAIATVVSFSALKMIIANVEEQ